MICGKCNNSVPENFAFCPYCGQKIEAPAPVASPVIARSAMPTEEEYSGRYETGNMPEPVIRFSKNLTAQKPAAQEPAPAAETPEVKKCACGALLREDAKFCNSCGMPVQAQQPAPVAEEPVAPPAPPVAEEPVAPPAPPVVEMPEVKKCACGAVLREGAKFCTSCGTPVQAPAAPAVEEPVAPPAPPVIEEPVVPPAPPAVEEPAVPPTPPVVEEPEQPQNKCPACGAALSENAKFCTTCGQKIQPAVQETPVQQPVIQPVQQPIVPPVQQPAAPAQQPVEHAQRLSLKKCPLCGTVVPADATVCTGCGVAFRVQSPAQQSAPKVAPVPPAPPKAPKTKKKSKAPLVIAIVVVLALIGVAVAGFMTDWFGLAGGPMDTVYDATNKTLQSGGFHGEFKLSVNSAVDVSGTVDCVIDIEEHELTALVEATAMGQTIRIGVMDGVAVLQDPSGYNQTMEIDYVLDEVFDMLEEGKSLDEALETGVKAALEAADMEDLVDVDEAVACVNKSLNSASWLKEHAGYSTENDGGVKLHVFNPKLGDLVVALVEALEPAFEDPDELEEGLKYLEEGKSEINEMADIELALGVQGGKLVSISGEAAVSGQNVTFELSFEDIGSAKVDTDELEDMMGGSAGNADMPAVAG